MGRDLPCSTAFGFMSRESRHQVSLALNLVLVVAVLALVFRKSERAIPAREVSPAKTPIEAPIANERPAVGQSQLPQYADISSAAGRRQWVEQLRAAGVPNKILAQVVLADFEQQWDKRVEECRGDANKITALQVEREKDQEMEMRAALGDEGFRRWDQENMLREANNGKVPLTDVEANAIYDLKKKLQQRRWYLDEARLNGEMDDAEINDETDKAYSEFNQQMKTLLGDERYAKSQGTDDGTVAANLRQDLAKANPSDSQFADLLKAQQELDQRRSELDKQFQDNPSSADYASQIKTLDATRDQEYQRVLGTNVFDSLQKEQDIDYSKMKKYENIWGLDDTKVDYVYGTIKYYEKSVEDYQAQARALEGQGQSVDWDMVNKNLLQFAQQTQQALQNSLGQDSFDKMQRNGVFQFNQSAQRGQIQ